MSPTVTLVIPAYREGQRLPEVLTALADQAAVSRCPATEIVVVDDGSPTEDAELERAAVERVDHRFRQLGAPHTVRFLAADRNRGKGAAIRFGWENAAPASEWLGFVDADGSVPAHEVCRVLRMLGSLPGVDVYAGTRMLMAGRTIERSWFRHVQGRVFATMAEKMFRLGFYDTQCGLKFFRGAQLRPLLPALREDRWLLDVEVLTQLQHEEARCVEVPVDWADLGGSKVVPLVDPMRMALGMLRLRSRIGASERVEPVLKHG